MGGKPIGGMPARAGGMPGMGGMATADGMGGPSAPSPGGGSSGDAIMPGELLPLCGSMLWRGFLASKSKMNDVVTIMQHQLSAYYFTCS